MRRVSFLVDGFNLYHSLKDASRALGGAGTRWLDLRALCSLYRAQIGGGAQVGEVYYFTSPADHMEQFSPGTIERHNAYLRALRATGVVVELGKFKEKRRRCVHCGEQMIMHEEKETDVAIAVRLLELLWADKCDAVAIVSGDSDLSPAIREAKRSFSQRDVYCLFPFGRSSEELRMLAAATFKIKKERYHEHQLPDPYVLGDGTRIAKPAGW